MINRLRVGILFKSIWVGMLGILTEISAALFFIFAGLIVCLVWWSLCK